MQKRSLTYYESLDKVPAMDKYEITDGRTYMYYQRQPWYEFGYDPGYTTFKYGNLQVKKVQHNKKDGFFVDLEVQNTGCRDGEEVVQLYVSCPQAAHTVPMKQLKGFKKVFIAKGKKLKFIYAY